MVSKTDFSVASYILGILSIVFAITSSFPGIVLGIIGIVLGKRQKNELSRRGVKFSIIGIILGILMFALSIIVIVLSTGGIGEIVNFPAA